MTPLLLLLRRPLICRDGHGCKQKQGWLFVWYFFLPSLLIDNNRRSGHSVYNVSVSFRLFLFLNSGDESSAEDESPTDAKFPMRAGKFVFVFFSSMKKKSSTPKRVSFFFFLNSNAQTSTVCCGRSTAAFRCRRPHPTKRTSPVKVIRFYLKKIHKHNPELEESYDALQMRPSLETRLTLRTRLTDVVALLVDRWRRQCLPRFNRTSLALFTRSLI